MAEKKRYKPIVQTEEYRKIVNEAREQLPPSLEIPSTPPPKSEGFRRLAVYLSPTMMQALDTYVHERKMQADFTGKTTRSGVAAEIIAQFLAKKEDKTGT